MARNIEYSQLGLIIFNFALDTFSGDGSLDKKEYIKCLAAFGIPENDSEDCYERILLILNRDKTDPVGGHCGFRIAAKMAVVVYKMTSF